MIILKHIQDQTEEKINFLTSDIENIGYDKVKEFKKWMDKFLLDDDYVNIFRNISIASLGVVHKKKLYRLPYRDETIERINADFMVDSLQMFYDTAHNYFNLIR